MSKLPVTRVCLNLYCVQVQAHSRFWTSDMALSCTCQFPPVRPPNNTNMRPPCLNCMQHCIYLSPNCPCRRVFRAQFLFHCQQQPQNNVANMIIFDAHMLPDGSPPRYIWLNPVCFSLASLLTQYTTRLVPGALPVSRWTPWTCRPCLCAMNMMALARHPPRDVWGDF